MGSHLNLAGIMKTFAWSRHFLSYKRDILRDRNYLQRIDSIKVSPMYDYFYGENSVKCGQKKRPARDTKLQAIAVRTKNPAKFERDLEVGEAVAFGTRVGLDCR